MLQWTFLYKFLCGHRLLSYIITPRLTSWGTVRLFSRVAAPFSFYPCVGFLFLHILANPCYLPLWFYWSSGCLVLSPHDSDLIFPASLMTLSIFLCAQLPYRLWINNCWNPLPIELFVFLLLICRCSLYYRHKFFISYMTCRNFSLILWIVLWNTTL